MSELNLNYYDIYYKIPYRDLILLSGSLNPDLKEKDIKIKKVKTYKNREVPVFNIIK